MATWPGDWGYKISYVVNTVPFRDYMTGPEPYFLTELQTIVTKMSPLVKMLLIWNIMVVMTKMLILKISLISLMLLSLRVSHQTKKQIVISRTWTSILLTLIHTRLPASLHKLIQGS